MEKKRLDWIDCAKGVGIICMVAGHVFFIDALTDVLGLLRMPLFFFIAGYLFKPNTDYKGYLIRKWWHLLVPYFAYCTALSVIQYLFTDHAPLGVMIERILLGGTKLVATRWMGPCWFITCFFIAQQACNFLVNNYKERTVIIIAVLSLAMAYMNEYFFKEVFFPWSANNALYAFPVLYSGYLYRKYVENNLPPRPILVTALVVASLAAACVWPSMILAIYGVVYGWPVLTFVIGLIMIHAVILLSKFLCKRLPVVAKPLRYAGKATLAVLCLNMFFISAIKSLAFRLALPILNNHWIILWLVISMCLVAYWVFTKSRITRVLFLGMK